MTTAAVSARPLAEGLRPGEPGLLVLKIGGSLVSDKGRDGDLDTAAVADFAAQVADLAAAFPGRLVLVAGGGSLGHGATRGLDEDDPHAVLGLTRATFAVKWAWTTALRACGVPALPVQVAALCAEYEHGVEAETATVGRLLEKRVLPVLSGDCLLTPSGGLRIFGSDHVPGILVREAWAPVRIVTLTDVPGVLADRPGGAAVLDRVDPDDPGPAYALVWETAPWDTSDAMRGKLDALVAHARRGAECVIARGDRAARDLRHLFSPMDEWPPDLPRTLISPPAGSRPAQHSG
ncbi:hypothetical protein ACFO3J_28455 [Streptomyces polygonati]|uniref:Aspartate/glutamate/uridylate kinase domain-containing protein n=1 Tax=Streptomyces polygonati TaxID=1617087 RepID=A0ABV8HWJ4_9ACTN